MKVLLLLIGSCLLFMGCNRASTQLEPIICCPVHPKEAQRENRGFLFLPPNFSISPFACLTEEELSQDWGKELKIAQAFASDFDLYRAITGFKRALILLPQGCLERKLEIEYDIVLAYYLGKKYTEALYDIQMTELSCVGSSFAAYSDLLLILYDCYKQLGECEKADIILELIQNDDSESAERLKLLSAIENVDFNAMADFGCRVPYINELISNFHSKEKSIRKAEALNAIFPGAGYWYVGQRQTALTAFVINSAFIAATAYFFDHGNIGAGIITLSLEGGWYFGGIYGAGLAAKLYNERLYEGYTANLLCQEKLFPLMMIRYSF